jgi:hypothetical protein
MHHPVKVLGLAVLLGCGARTPLPGGPGDGGAAFSSSAGAGGAAQGAGGFPPHPPCASADGVRLCGDGCPPLPAPECPGFGCTPTLDRTGDVPSGAGVCWADVPGDAELLCNACPDGQVCAYRSADQLVCVSEDVCAALWDLGATDVCRYADKSAYDHRRLQEPAGACPSFEPSPPLEGLCGGACGGCENGYRCTGRSPSHPFGMCVYTGAFDAPGGVDPCARAPDGTMLQTCGAEGEPGVSCAIFEDALEDEPAAMAYGVCYGGCAAVAAVFPGGMTCYNDAGQKVAP